jgi:hypothetical protein
MNFPYRCERQDLYPYTKPTGVHEEAVQIWRSQKTDELLNNALRGESGIAKLGASDLFYHIKLLVAKLEEEHRRILTAP